MTVENSGPRFSIVIPTRERADTLHHTLRTCLTQRFESYEIVVCDNYSSPPTRQTVESLGSSKIKYVRSERPLAMSENWGLAISHAAGEYVIVIGDDDGLLPYALQEINSLLQATCARALRWERVYYSWPNLPVPEYVNKLDIPLAGHSLILRSRDVIQKVANFEMGYTMLPMLYNSAIHRDLIATLRDKTKRVFSARAPDVYSGFAFAYLVGSYPSIGRPMTINAGSAKSGGTATVLLSGRSPIADEFHLLNTEAGLRCHPQVPDIQLLPAIIADAFQHAKCALFPNDSKLDIDRRRLAANCVRAMEAETPVDSEEKWKRYLQAIRTSLQDDVSLRNWFDSRFLNRVTTLVSDKPRPKWHKGFDGGSLHVDAADFGVTDVYGVAQLCEKILGSGRDSSRPPNLLRRFRSAAGILLSGFRSAARILLSGPHVPE